MFYLVKLKIIFSASCFKANIKKPTPNYSSSVEEVCWYIVQYILAAALYWKVGKTHIEMFGSA